MRKFQQLEFFQSQVLNPKPVLQIVETCQRIDRLIDRLPVIDDGEEAQLQRIAALQQRNEDAGARLQAELAAARAQLEQVQTLYAALADDKLQHRLAAAPDTE